jgi:transcriptional regulator with XRE-family HTH domain
VDADDPLWASEPIRGLVRRHDVGNLVRQVRQSQRIKQSELAERVAVSTSTVSRFENIPPGRSPDLNLAKQLAANLGIPSHVLGAALGVGGIASSSVTPLAEASEGEDQIQRRRFLTLAGLALPGMVLRDLDYALAGVAPSIDAPPGAMRSRFAAAKEMYDRGENLALLNRLPALLTLADQSLKSGSQADLEQYCAVHDLATDVLDKVGLVGEANVTARNSVRVSRETGSARVMAAADRGLSIVLRHQGKFHTANKVSERAAQLIEATGLELDREAIAYVQALCTHAYVAAQNEARDDAISAIVEAGKVASYMQTRMRAPASTLATAKVRMYGVSVHWALGDNGTAVQWGRKVDINALPTPERRARHYTDMARAFWSWQKPDDAAISLLHAWSYAPEEVRDRPKISAIVQKLTREHGRLRSVTQLAEHYAALTKR